MIITPEQKTQLMEAAHPLVRWMKENCHPHCIAHVDQDSVALFEGIAAQCPVSADREEQPDDSPQVTPQ